MLNIGLLLGGPSGERGISLNSARSVADHLVGDDLTLKEIIYFDRHLRAHSISRDWLYCNTPSDFDFKLSRRASRLTEEELANRLQKVDIVFPVIHGTFGEDGQVQALLERIGVPFVGSGAAACSVAFDKFRAHEALAGAGIDTVPSVLATVDMTDLERHHMLQEIFPEAEKLVLKPAQAGSSIDVHVAPDRASARKILHQLLARYERVVIQPRMTGVEMTTIVLEGPMDAVSLIPIEVEVRNRMHEDDILDYRRKYLASNDSRYYCPPRADDVFVREVQRLSEKVFTSLGLRDFARIDGWLEPDGRFLISDVNLISGMEQNSFLFIQAAQIGMSHADILRFVISRAADRSGVRWDDRRTDRADGEPQRRPVAVLFGGETAERQVSVLSGTNVWLKLLGSELFEPAPYLLDPDGSVWRLSYSAALRHSVEEIIEACHEAPGQDMRRAGFADAIHKSLGLRVRDLHASASPAVRLTLEEFLDHHDLVFIALHGGMGEDGRLQSLLDGKGIRYNGSDAKAARTCMDKFETGVIVAGLAAEGIYTARRTRISVPKVLDVTLVSKLWREIVDVCGSEHIVVKPVDDGCSAGVLPLGCEEDLFVYLKSINEGATRLSGEDFSLLAAEQLIELPTRRPEHLLFEEFIVTDDLVVDDRGSEFDVPARLAWGEERDTGWIEVTVGVLGQKGAMTALNPSITIATRGILSLEEKFMGGTGVNITPPPGPPLGKVGPDAVERAKARITRVANALGMAGYGRIDAFMHRQTGEIIIIEANALPGLTPATVFYHQGLAEEPPVQPRKILERIALLASDN